MNLNDNISKKGKMVFFYPTIDDLWEHVWFPFPYLYLSPFLEHAGFEVKIIDARIDQDWQETISREVDDAISFGVTAMTGPDLASAVEACQIVRETKSNLPIIWGGHHARQLPEQILNEGVADYVFTGAAEYSLLDFLTAIERGKEIDNIPGLVFYKNGMLSGNEIPSFVAFDYDISPAHHLLDIEKYRSPNNIVRSFTSRGCPFSCTFCTTRDFSNSKRTIQQVTEELDYLVNILKFTSIAFTDPIFFLSKNRVLKIAQIMMELGPNIKWKAQARATSLLSYSADEMKLLRKSGLRSIMFGIESGSTRILKNMDKRTSPADAIKSAEICSDFDFEFYGSFMFATPGETIDDLHQTISLIRKIQNIHSQATIQNSVYVPLPGTLMYKMCLAKDYQPPKSIIEWSQRDISSNFEKRDDITWIEPEVLREYARIYNNEFPNYKHVFEREKEGTYKSPFD